MNVEMVAMKVPERPNMLTTSQWANAVSNNQTGDNAVQEIDAWLE